MANVPMERGDIMRVAAEPGLPGAISDEAVATALESVRAVISGLMRDRDERDKRLSLARQEEQLWEQILSVRRGSPSPTPPVEAVPNATAVRPSGDSEPASGHPAVHAVIRELGAAGRPLHISDLMRLLRQKNVE